MKVTFWTSLFLTIFFSAAIGAAPRSATVILPAGTLAPFWITPKDKTGETEVVKIQAFESLTVPVTNGEFQKFLKTNPQWRKASVKAIFADERYLSQFKNDLDLQPGIKKEAPVAFVSWFAARAYCASKGMRLPTIVEWEYMAAASEAKPDASSDPEFLRRILEWYSEPRSDESLGAVGQRPANIYGLHDLHGLIWEWVDDFNSSLVSGEGRAGGSLNRDLFCGSGAMAGGNKENYAAFMRFAFRSSLKAASSVWNLGFRCVKGGPG